MKYFESGFEIWRGKSQLTGEPIVAILTLHSQNEKTGNMAQLWILRADMTPLDALQQRKDDAICGNCNLRHSLDGACYVRVGESPLVVYKALKNEAYTELSLEHYHELRGLSVRIAAYGDPAAIPISVLQELKNHVTNHTGYTHQWRSESAQELKSLCMASVEGEDEYREATAKGWRTFRILTPGELLLPGEILCPNNTRGVQCVKCQLCRGTSRPAKNIAIPVHGSKKNKFRGAATSTEHLDVKPLPPLHYEGLVKEIRDETPKIMSSERLVQMEFDSLNFENEWKYLFGLPSTDFHCIIHGKSGHGKSTFAIQFAKYLADNFGRVLYVSGEEGFSMTFQSKFVNNDAGSDYLDVADIRNYDGLIRTVPQGRYRFIFLDSLDTMKIDTVKLRKIKALYKNTALITISQATKAGQMRGSYEIVHDCDVAVEVCDGIATTTKNRFKERGLRFDVFNQKTANEQAENEARNYGKKVIRPFTKEVQIELLTKKLNYALEIEDYELAAELRDKIKKIQSQS